MGLGIAQWLCLLVHGVRYRTVAVSITTLAIGIAQRLCLLVHGLRYSTAAVSISAWA